ncbi:cytochrome d ubiquinol oxidase subunit II, partial [Escherichia sp. SS-MK2]
CETDQCHQRSHLSRCTGTQVQFAHGNFFQLLNPFGLLAGVVSVGMIITQGATYLQMRTVGELHLRTRATAQVAALVTLVCFA